MAKVFNIAFIACVLLVSSIQGWLLPKKKNWPVLAIGRITCDGRPMPHVFLRLMDRDPVVDEKMGFAHTDANGHFNVTGHGRDGRRRKPDPYIRVEYSYSGNYGKMQVVKILKIVRKEETGVKPYGSFIDFGTINFANIHCGAYMMFYEALKDFRARAPGIKLPYSMLYVRTGVILHGGTAYATTNVVRIPKTYSRVTLKTAKHELAHTIRHSFDGSLGHFLVDVVRYSYLRNHHCNYKTNFGFAFNEGWALYWASSCHASRYGNSVTDYRYEGNVAIGLRALERHCSSSPQKMVQVLRNNKGKIHSFQKFNDQHMALFGCKLP